MEQNKAKYAGLRDRSECIVIGDICNSTCMLVLGIVPLQRIRATPNVGLGFRPTNVDGRFIFGGNFLSDSGTEELMSIYPRPVKDWIRRHSGLAPQMKPLKNGHDLWMIVNPCPEPSRARNLIVSPAPRLRQTFRARFRCDLAGTRSSIVGTPIRVGG